MMNLAEHATQGFDPVLVIGWTIAFFMAVGLAFLFVMVTLDMLSGWWEEVSDRMEQRAFEQKWK